MPRLDSDRRKRLVSIEGLPPDLIAPPSGCRFNPRCQFKIGRCLHDDPPLMEVSPEQEAACWVTMDRALKKNGQAHA
jgi:oligopeptide/dipeptide ABC transporter ATP-binding protein